MKKISSVFKISNLLVVICLLFVVSLSSCNGNKDGKVKISGKIENAGGINVDLELVSQGKIESVASAKISEEGQFVLTLDTVINSFYRLKVDEKNVLYLRIAEGDEITINSKYPNISKDYKVTGSDDCELLRQMNLHLIESTNVLNRMNDEIVAARQVPGLNLDSLHNLVNVKARKLYDSDRQFLKDFIKTNHKSAVIYMALYQYVSISPVLTIESDIETFDYALIELKKHHPGLEQTALLESELSKEKLRKQQIERDYAQISPGVAAPDFVMQDAFSSKKSLVDYRGKNVVLAFWASWSKPSVAVIVKLSQYIKNTDAKLIFISLDTKKENWLSAIKTNEIGAAINLCDFKAWESSVLKIYGIKTLPTMMLINTEGIIEIITQDVDDIKAGLK